MIITIEATYENGMLKLKEPLPLKENETVKVTVQTSADIGQQAAGKIHWTGALEDLDYLIQSVENDPLESS